MQGRRGLRQRRPDYCWKVHVLDRVQGPRVEALELEQELAELDGRAVLDVHRADDALDLRLELVEQLHRLEQTQGLSRRRRRRRRRRTAAHRASPAGRRRRPSATRRAGARRHAARPAPGRAPPPRAARRRSRPWPSPSPPRVLRTVTRKSSSSIVTSAMPDSWTIRTISRIRSARSWSTPPAASPSSRWARPRIAWSSGSASSPKSASSSSSSSLAASPPACERSSSSAAGGSASLPSVARAAARPARRRGRCGRAARRSGRGRGRAARPRRPPSAAPRGRGASACEASTCPTGAASGGIPTSIRTRASSSRTSSMRSPAAFAREVRVEAGDEARRQRELRGAHRDPRRERDHRLVADVLVDQLGRAPQRRRRRCPRRSTRPSRAWASDSPETRWSVSATGYAAAGEEVGACPGRLDRARQRGAARALEVDADRQPARLLEPVHEVAGAARLERARRGRGGGRAPPRAPAAGAPRSTSVSVSPVMPEL